MLKRIVTAALMLLCAGFLPAQPLADTLLVYNITTKTTGTILPVPYPTTVTNAFTPSSQGSIGFTMALSNATPTAGLFAGSSFRKLARASSFFSTSSYPARTTVRLSCYLPGNQKKVCTGTLVGPCMVFASAASFSDFNPGSISFSNFDSIVVNPAFDNGYVQSSLPNTRASKIYRFTEFKQNIFECFALLELNQPIGNTIGWVGIGFNNAPNSASGKIFHKFSYPNDTSTLLVPNKYNGDTLYYNYGEISEFQQTYSINSNEAVGIPGQDGSTFLYTDNTNFYAVGMLLFSSNYLHSKLNQAAFFQLKNVLNAVSCPVYTTAIRQVPAQLSGFKIWPNPFKDLFAVDFEIDPSKHYELLIYSASGTLIKQIDIESSYTEVSNEKMPPGIYLIAVKCQGLICYHTKLIAE